MQQRVLQRLRDVCDEACLLTFMTWSVEKNRRWAQGQHNSNEKSNYPPRTVQVWVSAHWTVSWNTQKQTCSSVKLFIRSKRYHNVWPKYTLKCQRLFGQFKNFISDPCLIHIWSTWGAVAAQGSWKSCRPLRACNSLDSDESVVVDLKVNNNHSSWVTHICLSLGKTFLNSVIESSVKSVGVW